MANSGPLTRRDLFRLAATGGVAAAVGLNWAEGGPHAAVADTSTPEGALQALRDGNARWVAHNETSLTEDLNLINSGSTESHRPFAALLSCADARVSPEFLFDQVMGDLFITRVAGNIATPEIIASLEYSVAVLGTVKAIVVLGHGACGAVSAAAALTQVPGPMSQISALYGPLRPAVALGGNDLGNQIRANARIQAAILRESSPVFVTAIRTLQLKVEAAFYDLASGRVTFLPPLVRVQEVP